MSSRIWNRIKKFFSNQRISFLNSIRTGHDSLGFSSHESDKRYGKKYEQAHQIHKTNAKYLNLFIIFRLIGGTFFLIIFELAFYSMLRLFGTGLQELWVLQVWVLTAYAFFFFVTITSTYSKFARGFNFFYTLVMLSLVSIVLLILLLFFRYLILLKAIFSILTAYYLISFLLFFKSKKQVRIKRQFASLSVVLLILSSNFAMISAFYLTPPSMMITPKTTPELIFLCNSEELPENPEELSTCRQYKIGFMPVITAEMVGDKTILQKYKKILSYNLTLYVLMGGISNFYAYIQNSEEFPFLYEIISEWFKAKKILTHPALRGFYVDAETPEEELQAIYGDNITDSTNHGLEQYPLAHEIEKADEDYRELIRKVHADNKSCGIVRPSYFFDSTDKDGDLSLYTKNIYSREIPWDHEITMCYRTHYLGDKEGIFQPPIHVSLPMNMFLGGNVEGNVVTMSDFNLYEIVNLETENARTSQKEYTQHFFIGNFDPIFQECKYIKTKQFYTDVDICRHFNNEVIFFYDLKGFLYHYGWQGFVELGWHVKRHYPTYIQRESVQTMFFLLYCCGMILLDQFVFLEWELST